MFGNLLNIEGRTRETIQNTLEDVAEELGCSYNDFFIMIKPKGEDFDMRFDIFKYDENRKPAHVREITLNEILGT